MRSGGGGRSRRRGEGTARAGCGGRHRGGARARPVRVPPARRPPGRPGPALEPGAEAERFLERATHEAGANATGEYDWSAREGAVERVRGRLRPRLATLESSRVESGTVYRVSYDRAAAREWARANCPGRNGAGGEGREFGACVADRGVVVQERAGETVPVAVAYSVRVTGARGRYAFTFVCRVVE